MNRSSFDEYINQLRVRDPKMTVIFNPDKSAIALIRGRLADPVNVDDLTRTPFDFARRFIKENRILLLDINESISLVNKRVITDLQGMTHVSFAQKYGNALVWGGNVAVHYGINGSVYMLNSTLASAIDVPEEPRIESVRCIELAKDHAGSGASIIDGMTPALVVVDAMTLQKEEEGKKYYLCWKLEIVMPEGSQELGWTYFVDALEGDVLLRYTSVRTGSGTGHYSQGTALNSEASGTTHRLRDTATSSAWPVTTKPDIQTYDDAGSTSTSLTNYSEDADDNWNNVGPPRPPARQDDQGPEVDIHRYVSFVLDYYYTTHGYNGWDGAGSNILSHAHNEYMTNNAFWWGVTQKMYFSDGDGDPGVVGATRDFYCPLDIITHEYTHGVKFYFDILQTYEGETGALDEATSDLFGAFLKQQHTADGPWPWHQGRQTRLDGTVGRNMIDPSRDAAGIVRYDTTSEATKASSCRNGFYPDHYSIRYNPPKPWDQTNDYGGVHDNCPIITHAGYLMINGGTHRLSNVTVTGIGVGPIEQILYRVISTGLLTNTSDFADFRTAFITSCKDLFPGNLNNLLTVKMAFYAVGIGPDLGIHFYVDRCTFGEDEINARRAAGSAVVSKAFRVVIDGFTADEIGITGSSDTLNVLSPTVGMTITCTGNTSDNGGYGPEEQRFTFLYDIDFGTNNDAFNFPDPTKLLTLNVAIPSLNLSASAELELIKQPNPFIMHGDTPWLSIDLRVFVVKAGEKKFGVTMGNYASDAPGFIQDVMKALNDGKGVADGQSFDVLPTDQESSSLYIQPADSSGNIVFNFALAKVHYIGTIGAAKVRVFFRLLSTESTSTTYDMLAGNNYPMSGNYRFWSDGTFNGKKIPLAGIQGNNYVTIPCFALPRVDTGTVSLTTQEDSRTDSNGYVFGNIQDIAANSDGSEVDTFFGCWLDTNQPFKQNGDLNNVIPISLATNVDGPFADADNPLSIQQAIIRNGHQCLIAEIAFDLIEIPVGKDPSNWDKLAQRNIAWSDIGSAQAVTTFEIRPTPEEAINSGKMPDELMIDWGSTPEGSLATIYLPAVSIADVITMADRMYTNHRLEQEDSHTLRCATGGITYIPIPPCADVNYVGLLSVDLPATVHKEQVFNIVVQQVTNDFGKRITEPPRITETFSRGGIVINPYIEWRRVIGAFQLSIPVKTKKLVLGKEERLLSVFRWIEQAVPPDNRWYSVFKQYVGKIANRVDEFGGNSRKVAASPTGQWREVYIKCLLFMLVTILLIAIFLVGIGTQAGGVVVLGGIPVVALLAGTISLWWKNCRPTMCKMLRTVLAGSGIAALILTLITFLGQSTTRLIITLIVSFGIVVGMAISGWLKGCFKE